MERLIRELGEITNKSTGTIITRIKHGNAIAVIVHSMHYEGSPMYNQNAPK